VDDVIRPDGCRGTYAVLELKGGVGIVVVNAARRICLVGQYRYAPERYSWEIPKGAFARFDDRSAPLETAKKELREETGITAQEWRELGWVHTLGGSTNDAVCLYVAKGLQQGEPARESSEVIRVRMVTLNQYRDMVARGQITDATTIAAVHLAEPYL